MSARSLLHAALRTKTSAEGCCAAAPENNAPPKKDAPDSPASYSAGEFKPKSEKAPKSVKRAPKSVKRASVVLDFLAKTAALPKVAAKRPGRLDGDEALDKLARLHSKRKK